MKNSERNNAHGLAGAMESLNELFDEIAGTLDFMAGMGCKGADCSDQSLAMVQRWGRAMTVSDPLRDSEPSGAQPPHDPSTNSLPPVASYSEVSPSFDMSASLAPSPFPAVAPVDASLKEIEADVERCRRCSRCKTRQKIVFGSGPLGARLMFAGDWPDSCDDETAAICSPGGLLLSKMIEAMGLDRNKVQTCGLVKCRPDVSRRASPDEIQACLPFLKRHIRVAAPDIICAMGVSATSAFLGEDRPFSSLRGRFHSLKLKTGDLDGRGFKEIKVMPTHHPAWLLEHPADKREAWEDIQKIIKEYNR